VYAINDPLDVPRRAGGKKKLAYLCERRRRGTSIAPSLFDHQRNSLIPCPTMTDDRSETIGAPALDDGTSKEVRYPENHVVGLLDTMEQVESAVTALTTGGFLLSEIQLVHGAAAAEKLRQNTGRSGLAHLAMRFAEFIGIPTDETAIKNQYADGLGKGQLLLMVLAPTEERRRAAGRILEAHGGTNIRFFGQYTIQHHSLAD
jgi:hypothetical protein